MARQSSALISELDQTEKTCQALTQKISVLRNTVNEASLKIAEQTQLLKSRREAKSKKQHADAANPAIWRAKNLKTNAQRINNRIGLEAARNSLLKERINDMRAILTSKSRTLDRVEARRDTVAKQVHALMEKERAVKTRRVAVRRKNEWILTQLFEDAAESSVEILAVTQTGPSPLPPRTLQSKSSPRTNDSAGTSTAVSPTPAATPVPKDVRARRDRLVHNSWRHLRRALRLREIRERRTELEDTLALIVERTSVPSIQVLMNELTTSQDELDRGFMHLDLLTAELHHIEAEEAELQTESRMKWKNLSMNARRNLMQDMQQEPRAYQIIQEYQDMHGLMFKGWTELDSIQENIEATEQELKSTAADLEASNEFFEQAQQNTLAILERLDDWFPGDPHTRVAIADLKSSGLQSSNSQATLSAMESHIEEFCAVCALFLDAEGQTSDSQDAQISHRRGGVCRIKRPSSLAYNHSQEEEDEEYGEAAHGVVPISVADLYDKQKRAMRGQNPVEFSRTSSNNSRRREKSIGLYAPLQNRRSTQGSPRTRRSGVAVTLSP